ncbi:MAG: TatD family hydrolase [Elusimicrobiota bacterium]|jgi:TatD DNase family protein|nr:TatD family hydrolase [Elusimicrobiota bacterium]
MLIDSHAHITDAAFDNDREETVKRAFDLGISHIFEIACEEKYWDSALDLSQKENIFVSFGIHPHEAQNATADDFKKLSELISSKKCIAVGETGLDYHYDFSPRDIQKRVFARQIDLSISKNKPVIIHARKAIGDIIAILKSYNRQFNGVIHSFEGSLKEAQFFIDMGFKLGVCSIITYPKCGDIREVFSKIDISKLLIETDCPYRAPQNYRGKRNEPSFVIEIAKKLAEIKNMSFEEVCSKTAQNASNLFLENIKK